MSIRETNCAIHWIVIYPLNSAIHLLNNWAMIFSIFCDLRVKRYMLHFPLVKCLTEQLRNDVKMHVREPKFANF